jgi:hypothetical protein
MNMKRMRGRNHRPNGGGGGNGGGGFRNQQNGIPLNRNHVFDSSGPEMRVRGTAQQLYEKYQQMARDASSNGDRVTGEAYYQHAEHYFRIIAAINQAQGQPSQPVSGQQNGQGNYQPQHNGAQAGHEQRNHERGDYQRRDAQSGEQSELPIEARSEQPRENRPQENRNQENRNQEPRRFEQRPYEQRPKPEFPRQDRSDRPARTEQRFRQEPVVDARIDISSALEAELAAATAELPGFGEQPVIQAAPAAPEPRAIPIISDAPPLTVAAAPTPAPQPEAEPAPAPKVAKPRGRPRLVKAPVEEAK